MFIKLQLDIIILINKNIPGRIYSYWDLYNFTEPIDDLKTYDNTLFGGFYLTNTFKQIIENMKFNTIRVCFTYNCTYNNITYTGVSIIIKHGSYHTYPCAWIITNNSGIKYIEII